MEKRTTLTPESTQLFRDLFNASPVGIAVENSDGQLLFVNPALCSTLGFCEEEMRSEACIKFLHSEHAEKEWAKLRAGEIDHYQLEKQHFRRNGSLIWARLSICLLQSRPSPFFVAMVEDITEKKKAEEALLRYAAIVESSEDAIASGTLDGIIVSWNAGAQCIYGYTEAEAVGKPITILLPPELSDEENRILGVLKAGGSIEHFETVRVTKAGKRIDVSLCISPIRDSNGKTVACCGIARDITKRKLAEEALLESEELLRLAAQAGKMYAFEWDVTTDALVRSSEYVNVLGATEPRTLTHQQAVAKIHPDDRSKLVAAVARHSPGNPTVDVTYRVLLPGKSPVWVKSSGRAFFDKEGKMSRVIGMVADVTDQKLAEEALRGSEERLRLAQRAAHIGTFDWNIRTDVNTWTPELEVLYGLPAGSFSGTHAAFEDLVHPDDRIRLTELVESTLKTGKPTKGEWRVVWPDGSVHWLRAYWQVLLDESGEALRVIGVNIDITEQKCAEEAINESEERFRLVANASPVMIWMSGPDKRPTYYNQLWLDFTGLSETDLKNGLGGIVHPEDYKQGLDIYCRAFDQRQPFRKECRLRRHDGQYRWMLDIGVPRYQKDESFAGYIGSCIDVTDLKAAEQSLAEMSRKLIEAQEQERARIARELHDDINQRLAMLAVELEQLQDSPSEVVRRVQEIRKQISEISHGVQVLSHDLHSSPLEYLGVVAGMTSWCQEFGERHGLQIDCKHDVRSAVPSEVGLCLFRVLQEGLQNAAKHSGAQRIEVQLHEESGVIRLIVRDLGKGFDMKAVRQGRGLGLTSMQERVRLVNGTIEIHSKPMGGTSIDVRVPLDSVGCAAQISIRGLNATD